MRFPALATLKNESWLIRFRDLPGCQNQSLSEADVLPRAQQALDGWLTKELREHRIPRHPSRRVHLWKRERLLWVPVSVEIAVPLMIRWARTESRLTQTDLAKRLGVTQGRVAQLELPGARLSVETLKRTAEALNLRLDVLFTPVTPSRSP